jgi:hypothetical protein
MPNNKSRKTNSRVYRTRIVNRSSNPKPRQNQRAPQQDPAAELRAAVKKQADLTRDTAIVAVTSVKTIDGVHVKVGNTTHHFRYNINPRSPPKTQATVSANVYAPGNFDRSPIVCGYSGTYLLTQKFSVYRNNKLDETEKLPSSFFVGFARDIIIISGAQLADKKAEKDTADKLAAAFVKAYVEIIGESTA